MSDTPPVQPATTPVEKGAMRVIKQAGETVEEARLRRRQEAREFARRTRREQGLPETYSDEQLRRLAQLMYEGVPTGPN